MLEQLPSIASVWGLFPGEQSFMSGWHFHPAPLDLQSPSALQLTNDPTSAVRIRLAIAARALFLGSFGSMAAMVPATRSAKMKNCMVRGWVIY
jgi:hypothetical protein